jgi:hypothetical protein
MIVPKLASGGTHGTKHSYNNHPWLEIYNAMHVELNHFFVACGKFRLNFLLLVVISLETLVGVYIACCLLDREILGGTIIFW